MKYTIAQLILELQGHDKPWVMLMIGPPGVGKTTVLDQIAQAGVKFHIASTDLLVELHAREHALTYAQAYSRVSFKHIRREMTGSTRAAFARRQNVANDHTNMTAKRRRTTLAEAPPDYVKIGLSLNADDAALKRRLEARRSETGKHVSWGVAEEMLKRYSPPSKAEGFHYLWELTGDPR